MYTEFLYMKIVPVHSRLLEVEKGRVVDSLADEATEPVDGCPDLAAPGIHTSWFVLDDHVAIEGEVAQERNCTAFVCDREQFFNHVVFVLLVGSPALGRDEHTFLDVGWAEKELALSLVDA